MYYQQLRILRYYFQIYFAQNKIDFHLRQIDLKWVSIHIKCQHSCLRSTFRMKITHTEVKKEYGITLQKGQLPPR